MKMNEELQKVFDILEQNEELKNYYYKNPPKTKEEFIAAAKKLGVELTEDDLKSPTAELTKEELEQVAAGGRTKDEILLSCGGGALFICGIGCGVSYYG